LKFLLHLFCGFAIITKIYGYHGLEYPFVGNKEASNLNKKLGRFLKPNLGVYLVIILAFSIGAIFFGNYILAAISAVFSCSTFRRKV